MSNTDDTSHYEGAVLEDIQHQIQRLAEAMADVPQKVNDIDKRLQSVESDVKVIKAVVTTQSGDLTDLKSRTSALEQAAAL